MTEIVKIHVLKGSQAGRFRNRPVTLRSNRRRSTPGTEHFGEDIQPPIDQRGEANRHTATRRPSARTRTNGACMTRASATRTSPRRERGSSSAVSTSTRGRRDDAASPKAPSRKRRRSADGADEGGAATPTAKRVPTKITSPRTASRLKKLSSLDRRGEMARFGKQASRRVEFLKDLGTQWTSSRMAIAITRPLPYKSEDRCVTR